jgi:hypothetical protein
MPTRSEQQRCKRALLRWSAACMYIGGALLALGGAAQAVVAHSCKICGTWERTRREQYLYTRTEARIHWRSG